MSRLTSKAPFNRPSAFDVLPTRPTPLSPPETERESGLLQGQEENYASSEIHHAEGSIPRLRRNVAYTSTSVLNREPRVPQKQLKWLITVMPPASLVHEPPVLGHTLSSAPAGRFSNGILMPLFPTLYNQVTAIAREFNMPSTTGLCIYLQIQDSSSMLTPRISDETWQILWAQYFATDDRATALPSHGLPIAGRVEFDIDLRRAKWFNNWMGNHMRDRVDVDCTTLESSVVPTHWRGDSRYSIIPAEQPRDDSPSPPSVNAPSFRAQRQLPRPLFLEKRDTPIKLISRHPSRVPSISQNVNEHELPAQRTLPAEATVVPAALFPVAQSSEELVTTKKAELDTLVLQWRASSVVSGVSMAITAAGQPSLDPVSMPPGVDVELDLDDFAWSISSAGPPSESPMSPHWPEPLPSIHLVDRLQGSVCLTPTTCTSWGPVDAPDYSIADISRQPSPDLGLRMMEFVPLTPSTVTSWGPEDLPSPSLSVYDYAYRPHSIDIGQRATGSVPVTPSTATSWGPADSPLFSPETPPYILTPDIGERGFADLQDQPVLPVVLLWHDAQRAKPWRYVWPYLSEHNREIERALLPEYPDFTSPYPSDNTQPWTGTNNVESVYLNETSRYPHLELYPAVYPHNLVHIYRPALIPTDILMKQPGESTNGLVNVKPVNVPSHYPVLDIYPTVYPHNMVQIYPPQYGSSEENNPTTISNMRAKSAKDVYPYFDLYPAVYPHNLHHIYPAQNQDASKVDDVCVCPVQRIQLLASYPLIEPYPPVYPYNLERIYPMPSIPTVERAELSGASTANNIGVYRAQPTQLSVSYPLIEPYPLVYPFNLERIYQTLTANTNHAWVSSSPKSSIAELDVSSYPHNLNNIYPPNKDAGVTITFEVESRPTVLLPFKYPVLNIYPSVYPYNMEQIYPNKSLLSYHAVSTLSHYPNGKLQTVTLNHGYPVIEIYPNVYPHNLYEIYPSLTQKTMTQGYRNETNTWGLLGYRSSYAEGKGYPHNLLHIYSSEHATTSSTAFEKCIHSASQQRVADTIECPQELPVNLEVTQGYPVFNLYPIRDGYPTIEIYPPVIGTSRLEDITSLRLGKAYPFMEIYEPIYPHLVIYPSVLGENLTSQSSHPSQSIFKLTPRCDELSVRLTTTYPSIHLYEPVYPHLVIYPTQMVGYVEYFGTEEVGRRYRKRVPTPGPDHRQRSRAHPLSSDHEEPRASRSHVKRPLLPPLLGTIPSLPSNTQLAPHLYMMKPAKRFRRTHHELYMMIYDEVQRAAEHQEKVASDLLLWESIASDAVPRYTVNHSPTTVSRQRSRSGTTSSQFPRHIITPSHAESQVHSSSIGGTLQTDQSPVSHNLRSASTGSPGSSAPPLTRRTVIGLPSSPTQTRGIEDFPAPSSVLTRVRSMNSRGPRDDRLEDEHTTQGLGQSKSLLNSNVSKQRQSVLDRARMFSVTKQTSEAHGPPSPLTSTMKPASKLDRSKIPFS